MQKQKLFLRPSGRLLAMAVLLLGMVSSAFCDQSEYDGDYAGTYTGDDSGYWVMLANTIIPGPAPQIIVYSTAYNITDAASLEFVNVDWVGENGGIGNYSSPIHPTTQVDMYLSSADGSVTGDWQNATGDIGTLMGNKIANSTYAGTCSGTFGGDYSGTWELTIAADGHITGSMTVDNFGTEVLWGICHPEGYIFVAGEFDSIDDDTFWIGGRISGTNISGSYKDESGDTGTFAGTGSFIGAGGAGGAGGGNTGGGSGGSSSGGGGGGGCFINSLTE